MNTISICRALRENSVALLLSTMLFGAIVFQSSVLFLRSRDVMHHQLDERLRTAAALASQQFAGQELDSITEATTLTDTALITLVERLQAIRSATPNIQYAYIMRRTDDPNMLEFVADADALQTFVELDVNGDGTLQPEEENSLPGDLYDISDVPAMQGQAFMGPTVDAEITQDQWGYLISGYAPIYRADGSVAGILGLDMDATEFVHTSTEAYSGFALMTMLLIGAVIVLAIIYIVWERRKAMQQTLDQERSALLALATHQLGTPVSSIRWWTEMLKDNTCDFDAAVAQIADSAEQISDIVQKLIEVEQREHGNMVFVKEPASIRRIVEAAVAHAPLHLLENREIQINIDEGLTAHIDKALTESVLIELIGNAITYTPKNTPIHISAHEDAHSVHISVQDFGEGIPLKEQQRIFQKFTRGENAGKYRPDGNGLGLYVVKLIVQKAGGDVHFKSKEGEGSTFTVSLPK